VKRLFGSFFSNLLGGRSAQANSQSQQDQGGDIQQAEARKAQSIAKLTAEGVPVIAHLPVVATEGESVRRPCEQVVQRAIALFIVAAKADTGDLELVERLIEQAEAAPYFTPAENAFLSKEEISDGERIAFSWRYEALNVLLWALGVVPSLGRPDSQCDAGALIKLMFELGPDGLQEDADLRPQSELLSAADLIYRYHWAVVDARLKGQEPPAGLEGAVVYERHYALNWLIGYSGPDWDDISTDT
jgi:hypothetical protein